MTRENLDSYLARLEAALTSVRRHLAPGPEERGSLTPPQFIVLKFLLSDPSGLPASELATRVGVSGSAMTGMVDRLAKSGLVERRRSDEDRRVVWVKVTDEGRQVVASAMARRRARFRQLFSRVDEARLGALVAALEDAVTALDDDASPGGGCPG